MKSRIYEKYVKDVQPALLNSGRFKNIHEVPRMEKIVINMGVSSSLEKVAVDDAAKDLTAITGQKTVINKAKKSVANFKLRKGQSVGCRVTLRRDRMYEFFDRLVATALPRIREVSARIATAVANVAYQNGLADGPPPNDLSGFIEKQMYDPRY